MVTSRSRRLIVQFADHPRTGASQSRMDHAFRKQLMQKNPCGVPYSKRHATLFAFLSSCSRVRKIGRAMDTRTGRMLPYWLNRPRPNLRKSCLRTFAGKLAFGCVFATAATDVPKLAFTGVARNAWISPALGPLSTVAMPEI